jgi:hypothetical protein
VRRVFLLVVVAATAAAVAPQVAVSASRGACAPSWRAFAARKLPGLADVGAVSATDVWAVGATGSTNAARPRIVHWDGRKLTVVPGFRPSVAFGTATGK